MATATREPETDAPVEESPEPVPSPEGPEEPGDTAREPAPEGASIFERMVAILGEMPAIGKTQRNTEQNFMFRGHDDVMNALNPLLAKHGVFFVPTVIKRTPEIRATARGATMYEVNLCVRYYIYGAAGDHVEAVVWGEGTDMGDKATNKAMTMAFKNVLAQVFALATAELSDADAQSPEETTRGGAASTASPGGGGPALTDKQKGMLERIASELDEKGVTLNGRRPWDALHVRTAIVDMTKAQASAVLDLLIAVNKQSDTTLVSDPDPLDAILGPPREGGDFPPEPEPEVDPSAGYGN